MSEDIRKIIHLDMDAFYASVEQRDRPELRNRPIAVGGTTGRGVIATASYEARKFGVHSAMPSRTALRLCPELIIVSPRIGYYKESSEQFRSIMLEYTDLIEPLSLDEAFMDVTHNKKAMPSATMIAQEIRDRVKKELGLSCSAGISINKFLAKVASDLKKPDGLSLIGPESVIEFMEKLPIQKFHGIGKVTAAKLVKMGILTGKDLKMRSEKDMHRIFGKSGTFFYQLVRGIDQRLVNPHRTIKSVSVETTFETDVFDFESIKNELNILGDQLERRIRKRALSGRTLTLKIKFADFKQITRSKTTSDFMEAKRDMITPALAMLELVPVQEGIRLLGIGISNFKSEENEFGQLTLSF